MPRFLVRLLTVLGLVAAPSVALAQSEAAPPPKDTIFARKILMGAIDMNMDEVETMLAPEGKLDHIEAREHLDSISVLLMAFPHMFPASTNLWREGVERDPAVDTFAAPELWTSFADFYQGAKEASQLAFEASHARRAQDFKAQVAELRSACNSCHAKYLKAP